MESKGTYREEDSGRKPTEAAADDHLFTSEANMADLDIDISTSLWSLMQLEKLHQASFPEGNVE
jgi:hypothetical protein